MFGHRGLLVEIVAAGCATNVPEALLCWNFALCSIHYKFML
ncbi:hypothetical protein APY03_7718 [Variovorax sp. WDL1]|nr:hypothetical protein APY03_7718 [Variovorax sp. WDL1]